MVNDDRVPSPHLITVSPLSACQQSAEENGGITRWSVSYSSYWYYTYI